MAATAAGATMALSEALHVRAGGGIPSDCEEAARGVLLDGLACLIAGAGEAPARVGRAAAAGRSEASAVGVPQRVDAPAAAYANGIAIHALDFEPIGAPPCHAPATVLPAALALAESAGRSGREVLVALALGWEVESRLRAAGRLRAAFHPLGVYGPVAAAAACAVLIGLDPAGIENALGIAASSAGGLAANGHTPVKVVHSGAAARAGLVAALQARDGVRGARSVLEMTGGYGDAFYEEADWNPLAGIGADESYALTTDSVIYKPYPVQLPMLNVIDTVLDVRPPDLDPAGVARLELEVGTLVASRSNPRPSSGHAGKFSAEYCAAVAVVFGEVGIASFEDDVRSDPRVVAAIDRIVLIEQAERGMGDVTARLVPRAGGVREASRAHPRGSVSDPLTRHQRLAKVRDCLASVGADHIGDELADVVAGFETVEDVARLGALLRKSI